MTVAFYPIRNRDGDDRPRDSVPRRRTRLLRARYRGEREEEAVRTVIHLSSLGARCQDDDDFVARGLCFCSEWVGGI